MAPTTTTSRLHGGDFDGLSTETTPLIRSEAASSGSTIRDVSPSSKSSINSAGKLTGEEQQQQPLGWKRVACITLSMWALMFLQASNMSGISTIQSTIAADLDAYESAMWFTSSFLISASSVSPLVGRLAMIFSPGVMLLVASFLFALGTLITSQARSFAVFVMGRIIVGIGAGGVMTLSMILVIQLTSKRRRGLWIGLVNAGFTIGVSVGAVVFGAALPHVGWRVLFWAQSPVSILAGFGVFFSVPQSVIDNPAHSGKTTLQKLASIDYAGAASLTTAIVLLLYGLSGKIEVLPIILSIPTFAIFLLIERLALIHGRDPIIPLTVLRSRPILFSCFAQLFFMACRWTVLYYAPIFFLAVRGASPALAGSILIPTNLGFGVGGLLAGWLHIRRSGSYWLACLASMSLFTVAIAAVAAQSTESSPLALYVATVFVNGLATGAATTYTMAHLLHLASPSTHYIVTGLLTTFRGFAGSFGTAIGGGIFVRSLRAALTDGFARLEGSTHLSKARQKLITVLIGSPATVYMTKPEDGSFFLSVSERLVALRAYESSLRTLYLSATVLCLLVIALQAGTGWKGLSDEDDRLPSSSLERDRLVDREREEQEVERLVAEHEHEGMEA